MSDIYSPLNGTFIHFLLQFFPKSKYDHRKPLKTQKGIIEVINEIGDESEAIKRAEVLLQIQDGVIPLIANPSTKVHLLVQEIREWAKYFHIP